MMPETFFFVRDVVQFCLFQFSQCVAVKVDWHRLFDLKRWLLLPDMEMFYKLKSHESGHNIAQVRRSMLLLCIRFTSNLPELYRVEAIRIQDGADRNWTDYGHV